MKETLKRAKELFDRGELVEAKSVLEKELSEEPGDAGTLNFLAYLHYRLGDLASAGNLYRRLAEIEPENPAALSNLGLVAYRMELHEEAIRAFKAYLRLKPDDAKVRSYLDLVMGKLAGGQNAAPPESTEARADTPVAPRRKPSAGTGGEEAGPAGTFPRDSGESSPVAEREGAGEEDESDFLPAGESAHLLAGAMPLAEWLGTFEGEEEGLREIQALSSHLVSVTLENRICFALPSLVMYRGVVLFEQGPNPYGKIPRAFRNDALVLMAAEGNGRLCLSHKTGWLATLLLENDVLVVNAHNLVAFDAALRCDWLPLGKERFLPNLAPLRFSGIGPLVLAAGEGLASCRIKPPGPAFFQPSSIVAWTGGLTAEVDAGDDLKKVKDFFDSPFVRFEGAGRVFVSGTKR